MVMSMNNDLKHDALKIQCKILLNNAEFIISKCEEALATDEQWFIDFEMKMSELVTKDHSKKF